jgi:hypothetical protein
VSLLKRVKKIETSLTPKEMALSCVNSLKDILNFDPGRDNDDLWLDPRGLRARVARKIGKAVRENLADPPLGAEALDQAVREAQKQTDTLLVLILDVNQHVRSESRVNKVSVDLVIERYLLLLEREAYKRDCDAQAWESWRAQLITTWIAVRRLEMLVDRISDACFDGRVFLWAENKEGLHHDRTDLERLAKSYDRFEGTVPDWKAINLDAELSSVAEYIRAQAEHRVSMAKAKTLSDFGESEAATNLLDSSNFRITRELNLLRSSSQTQERGTC